MFQNLELMTSGSNIAPEVANMSDLEEAERFMEAHAGLAGVGEDIYDSDGFNPAVRLFGPDPR